MEKIKELKEALKIYEKMKTYWECEQEYDMTGEYMRVYDMLERIEGEYGRLPCMDCAIDGVSFYFSLDEQGEILTDMDVDETLWVKCARGDKKGHLSEGDKPGIKDICDAIEEYAYSQLEYQVQEFDMEFLGELVYAYELFNGDTPQNIEQLYEWLDKMNEYLQLL